MGLRNMYWVKYHLNYLRTWREAVKAVARAVRDLDSSAEVYVVGGAAEDRLTVLSDIDVIVVPSRVLDDTSLNKLRRTIYVRAVDFYNLPWDYPVEIHILMKREFDEVFTKKNKKIVRIE